jgi:hypothetical protein
MTAARCNYLCNKYTHGDYVALVPRALYADSVIDCIVAH